MQITLTEEPTFTAQVGDFKIEGLRVISEWNGMKELRNVKGEVLIVGGDWKGGPVSGFSEIFGNIFGIGEQKSVAGTVISGSPDLVALLKSAQPIGG
jgi:hypothetical protein